MKLVQEVRDSFAELRGCPKELWIVYTLQIIDGFAYFSLGYSLVLYLSEEFGFDDMKAGWVYGVHGMLTSVFGLTLGFVIDIIGVRNSLIFANVTLFLGRFWLAGTQNPNSVLIMLYVVIPIGQALLQPAMTTGIRRYTNNTNRTMGFSLFYVALNLGALLAAPLVDVTRSAAMGGVNMPLFGHMSAYRVIILVGALSTLLSVLGSLFVSEVDMSATGPPPPPTSPLDWRPYAVLVEVMSTTRFWKFMLLNLLLVGVSMIFQHLDATFPKYMVRTHGDDVPFGSIISINPFLIIFIVPALTPFVKRHGQYNMILLGSSITATSVLWMVAGPASLWCAMMFVIMLSFGEALWSPRIYEYTSMIAPKGREGTYMALSSAPKFASKVVVGGLSGWVLEEYCPSKQKCHGGMLWLIVFLVTASSPVLMFLLRGVIKDEEVRDEGDNDDDNNGHDGHDGHDGHGHGDGEVGGGGGGRKLNNNNNHTDVDSDGDGETRKLLAAQSRTPYKAE